MKKAIVLTLVLAVVALSALQAAASVTEGSLTTTYQAGLYHSENLGGLHASAHGYVFESNPRFGDRTGMKLRFSRHELTDANLDGSALAGEGVGSLTRWDLAATYALPYLNDATRVFAGWSDMRIGLDSSVTAVVPAADDAQRQRGPVIGLESSLPLGKGFQLGLSAGYRPGSRVTADSKDGTATGLDFRAAARYTLSECTTVELGYASSQYRWEWDGEALDREQCVYGFFLAATASF